MAAKKEAAKETSKAADDAKVIEEAKVPSPISTTAPVPVFRLDLGEALP